MYVTEKSKMPKGLHWAIVEFDSITIPGDERSRTHPGHGYPEYTQPVVNYIAFSNENDWKTEIEKRVKDKHSRNNWIAIQANPATIETTVSVAVKV